MLAPLLNRSLWHVCMHSQRAPSMWATLHGVFQSDSINRVYFVQNFVLYEYMHQGSYLTQCAVSIISGAQSASALTKARRERVAAALESPRRISQIARFAMTQNTNGMSPASSASCWERLKLAAAPAKSPSWTLHEPFRHHVLDIRAGSL